MNTDHFDALRPPQNCISSWTLSRAALNELSTAERGIVMAHVGTCERCATCLAEERAALTQAQNEDLPPALMTRPTARVLDLDAARQSRGTGARSPMRRVTAAVGILAAAALAFFVTRPTDSGQQLPPVERAKEALEVRVAVQRGGVLVADNVAANAVGRLAIDDQLRVRVGRQAGAHIVVAGFEGGAWIELFRGLAPEDGWLPLGLVVTAGDPPRLRVFGCENEPIANIAAADTTPEQCVRADYTFEVQ